MFKLVSNIQIFESETATKPKWILNGICNCDIENDSESLTDTCTITIPRKVKWQGQAIGSGSNAVLKYGMKVKVFLGYGNITSCRFFGYIRETLPGTPIKIKLEDSMFLLKKQAALTKSYKNITIGGLLADILPAGIEYVTADKSFNIEKYRIKGWTPAKVLEDLRKDYGLVCTFRNESIGNGDVKPVLYVGLPSTQWSGKNKTITVTEGHNRKEKANFLFNKNDISFQRAEDIRIKVNATSIQSNNKKLKAEAGDADGEVRTVFAYNKSVADLQKLAESELSRFKYTGIRGSFEMLGRPEVEKGDFIKLELSEGSGTYFAKKVNIFFGKRYKQTVQLGGLVK